MWNIQKEIKKGDYLYALVPEHPKATKNGYVLYHRVIMENYIGRLLTEDEVVHHKDENKHNNCIGNLEILNKNSHARLHASKGRTFLVLSCPNCGKSFKRERRQIKPNTNPKCSRKCNGEFSRKIQLQRGCDEKTS